MGKDRYELVIIEASDLMNAIQIMRTYYPEMPLSKVKNKITNKDKFVLTTYSISDKLIGIDMEKRTRNLLQQLKKNRHKYKLYKNGLLVENIESTETNPDPMQMAIWDLQTVDYNPVADPTSFEVMLTDFSGYIFECFDIQVITSERPLSTETLGKLVPANEAFSTFYSVDGTLYISGKIIAPIISECEDQEHVNINELLAKINGMLNQKL